MQNHAKLQNDAELQNQSQKAQNPENLKSSDRDSGPAREEQ